jgi:hypothetical protein
MPNFTVNGVLQGAYIAATFDVNGNLSVATGGGGVAPTPTPTRAPATAPVPSGVVLIDRVTNPVNGQNYPNGQQFYTDPSTVADATLEPGMTLTLPFVYDPNNPVSRITFGPGNFGEVDRFRAWISASPGNPVKAVEAAESTRNAPTLYFPHMTLQPGREYYANLKSTNPLIRAAFLVKFQ